MCNEAARRLSVDQIHDAFQEARIPLLFPESLPNLAPLDSIRITDTTVIVRMASDPVQTGAADLVQRRWSWPGPTGKPVYNYRSEGRDFRNTATGGRCLIPLDGFYEFTDPALTPGAPRPKRKDKWLFTMKGADLFCVAGLWRLDAGVGEAFTMLTCPPGPDIAPYHSRQIVLMPPERWAAWLGGTVAAHELIAPTPAGVLDVAPARLVPDAGPLL